METQDEDVEVAEIRADIEDTRREMGGTLNELGERLDPGHLVEQAKDNVLCLLDQETRIQPFAELE
jgi:hypothetical protein